MHTLLDHDERIPAFVAVTEAKAHDRKSAPLINLPKGSIVVFDEAYNSYAWFQALTDNDIFFVTRLKENARYQVGQRRPVRRKIGLTSDQTITVKRKKTTLSLRRTGYRDPDSGKHFQFLTNNFRPAPKTIADIYKERWKIEIFIREIKQNLHIKSFVGTSENAVLIQLFTALTVYMLMAYMKHLDRIGLSVQLLFQLVQLNLMGYYTLSELLQHRQSNSKFINHLPLFSSIC